MSCLAKWLRAGRQAVDRDLVLAGLPIITVGLTLLGAAPWPPSIKPRLSARHWEQAAWRAL